MAIRAGGGTGMLVSLVVFVVATVALLVVSIVLYAGQSKAREEAKDAQASLASVISNEERSRDATRAMLAEAASSRQSLFAELARRSSDIATFVSGDPNAGLDQMRRELGVPEGQTVRTAISNERGQVRKLTQDLDAMKTRLSSAEEENRRLQNAMAEAESRGQAALAAAQASIDEYARTVDSLRAETQSAVAEIGEARSRIEARFTQRVRDLERQIDELNRDNAVLRTRAAELDRKVNEVRPKSQNPAELVDGRIIDVVGADRQVFIDLGRKDRLQPGITFEVYDDGSAIQIDPATGEYARGKASIQIIKVGDISSTGRIVRESRATPVVPGDVLANAVFDKNTRFKFLVYGKFDVDGDGRATAAEAEYLKQQVRDWGGVVAEGDELTGDLDFLVLGVQPTEPGPLPPTASAPQIEARLEAQAEYDRYDRLFRRANEAQIPVLNANRFEILTGSVPR
ncbi:MAG: hypothetical protein ACO3Y3_01360 [Phycisphaerales bacterium]